MGTRGEAPYILSKWISRLQLPWASPRPAAILSAVGLSQHAVENVKVFLVNFALPSLSSGTHRCGSPWPFPRWVLSSEVT